MDKIKASLFVMSEGSSIRAWCSIDYGFVLDNINPAQISINLLQLTNTISQNDKILPESMTDIWAGLADPMAGPDNPITKEAFEECLRKTANAGSTLFLELKKDIGEILEKINALPDGSYLTINTNCAFLPWEILTPEAYDESMSDELPKRELMWGYRFITNYSLPPKTWTKYHDLFKAHQNGKPFVSFNLNPTIDNNFKTANFKPVERQEKFYSDFIVPDETGNISRNGAEIRKRLVTGEQMSTLIYIYCHGNAAAAFGEQGLPKLEVDEGVFIEPSNVTKSSVDYKRGAVIFLNSCESGSHSPAVLTNFLEAFRDKNAIGVIGTVIKIPATFAAAFGCEVIKAYLQGKPLGVVLFGLRRRLIDLGNPLGLFYSLQCPAEISVSV